MTEKRMPPVLSTDRIELHFYFMGQHHALGVKFSEVPVRSTWELSKIMHYFETSIIQTADRMIAEHEEREHG